jgi:hypothetical protein
MEQIKKEENNTLNLSESENVLMKVQKQIKEDMKRAMPGLTIFLLEAERKIKNGMEREEAMKEAREKARIAQERALEMQDSKLSLTEQIMKLKPISKK